MVKILASSKRWILLIDPLEVHLPMLAALHEASCKVSGNKRPQHWCDSHANYEIGGRNLSRRWVKLVGGWHIVATTDLSCYDDEDSGLLHVRYGMRLEEEMTGQRQRY